LKASDFGRYEIGQAEVGETLKMRGKENGKGELYENGSLAFRKKI
jgi:hypothetical protein